MNSSLLPFFRYVVAIGSALLLSAGALAGVASRAEANPVGGLSGTLTTQNVSVAVQLGYSTREIRVEGQQDDLVYRSRRAVLGVEYGLLHYVNLYAEAGMADAELTSGADFQSPLTTQFGGGVKLALLPRTQSLQVILDGELLYYEPSDQGMNLKILEYQVAAYAKIPAEGANIYGGLQYSGARLDGSHGFRAHERDHIGAFIGADYFVNPNIFFNAEMHIFDQQALFLGVGYRL